MNAFSNLPLWNPYIATSSWVPSPVMAEQWDKDSPDSGCKWSPVVTPWQTSVNRVAVVSLTSLYLTAGKPPVLQVKACSTLHGCSQLQCDGKFRSGQPYLRERLSLKAALCIPNPYSSMGNAVSQMEVPFSWESSLKHWRGDGKLCWSPLASSFYFVHLMYWICLLKLCWSEWQLSNWQSWLMIWSTSGALI